MEDQEVPLEGGNATDGVVRVGSTVRKPWTPNTAAVFEFMEAVRADGVDVPATFGKDDQGRQVTEFIPGHLVLHAPPLTLPQLTRAGALVRSIHDAAGDFTPSISLVEDLLLPAPDEELMCHNDLAPWNLILGERWVFIDWDGAGPSTRLWDLAYAAQAFTLSDVNEPPDKAAVRLAAFVHGYGADHDIRKQLPATMALRTKAMYDMLASSHLVSREPWGSMYSEGHGDHWDAVTTFVESHQRHWAYALSHNDR
jgi:tRNA A-37 threonylcarbamoyl transferase component Bud32